MEQVPNQVIKEVIDQEQKAVVLVGATFKIPGTGLGVQEECDVVVVFRRLQFILCIESKIPLNDEAFTLSMARLGWVTDLLENYIGDSFPSGEWINTAMVEDKKNEAKICPPFTLDILRVAQSRTSIETLLRNKRQPLHNHPDRLSLLRVPAKPNMVTRDMVQVNPVTKK